MEINKATLIQWYNKCSKREERRILECGISGPTPKLDTSTPLPAPLEKPTAINVAEEATKFKFITPSNTAGKATLGKKLPVSDPTTCSSIISSIATTKPRASTTEAGSSTFIPSSTACYRRRVAKEIASGLPVKKYRPRTSIAVCSKCQKPRIKETHTQYYGNWFCSETSTETLEEWKAKMAEMCQQRFQQTSLK